MTSSFKLSRREFLNATTATAAAVVLPSTAFFTGCGDTETEGGNGGGGGGGGGNPNRYFYFVMISDSHAIDHYYEEGTESNDLDNESILKANERLADSVDQIKAFEDRIDFVLHGGDILHRLPLPTLAEYFEEDTAIDLVASEFARFDVPIHAVFGNHDYRYSMLPKEDTHDLFKAKLEMDPYTSFDHQGWRFIMTNCYLGLSQEPGNEHFDSMYGSFGQEQLEWMRTQLADGLPTVIVVHQPPGLLVKEEPDGPLSFEDVVREFSDTIVQIYCGHWHRWFRHPAIGGVPVLGVGATRYDEDAMIVVRVDTENTSLEIINIDPFKLMPSHETPRFDPSTVEWAKDKLSTEE